MGNTKKDHFYAEMLEMMRAQGRKDNPITIQIGIMQSPTSVRIDDLVLEAEDLYIADHLMEGYKRAVKLSASESLQGNLLYVEGLKKGDLVAVQRLDNNEYLILERVVRA